MKKLFEAVTDWQRKTFTNTMHGTANHLKLEIDEFLEAAAALDRSDAVLESFTITSADQHGTAQKLVETHNAAYLAQCDELADLQFLVINLAMQRGYDYEQFMLALWRKFSQVKYREYAAPDADGVQQHINPATNADL